MERLDKGYIYRRDHWDKHIAFAWCESEQGWRYINVAETKRHRKLVFKEAYHSTGNYSRVGELVLMTNNLGIYTELMRYIDNRVNIVFKRVKRKKMKGFVERINHKLKEINNDRIRTIDGKSCIAPF